MDTLLLNRQDVKELLTIEECTEAVETMFANYAQGKVEPPKILGIHAKHGGFHIKAGIMESTVNYFVAKSNANFPLNSQKSGLPSIQGVIIVCDANNGRLLALMDSIEITVLRTGAATAVAAKYLSANDSKTITIIGCGEQGKISLRALMYVRRPEQVFVFDPDNNRAELFAKELSRELNIAVTATTDLENAVRNSRICITCTPSKQPFLKAEYISPGTFIAAVGADSEEKQELYPDLLAKAKVITDLTAQCRYMGELHHALEANTMLVEDVYAELGEIITGKKKGRINDEEIIVFDSTGTALQDIAAATIVYEKALRKENIKKLDFSFIKKESYEVDHTGAAKD